MKQRMKWKLKSMLKNQTSSQKYPHFRLLLRNQNVWQNRAHVFCMKTCVLHYSPFHSYFLTPRLLCQLSCPVPRVSGGCDPCLSGQGMVLKCWTIPDDSILCVTLVSASPAVCELATLTHLQARRWCTCRSCPSLPTRSWSLLHQLSSLAPIPSLLFILIYGCYLLLSSFPSFSAYILSLLLLFGSL